MSGEVPWQRLDPRVIWVDAVVSLLSLAPAGLAVWVFGVEPRLSTLWPALVVAAFGVTGATRDVLRWVKTRYRVTGDRVELRTGLLVRAHRSVRRERIRSVEATALLRHRLAGLRVLTVGAGLPGSGAEAALRLDAVSATTAERLRRELLRGDVDAGPDAAADDGSRVYARIRWSWIVHNVANIWAFVMAAGLLWGGFWTAQAFGFDPVGAIGGLVDPRSLGTGWSIALAVSATGVLGAFGLACAFVAENWGFRLARVPTAAGTVLRTTQGLLKTRAVDRDDDRLRGVQIAEPVLWRWMGTADTDVVTTGLRIWSLSPATTILPRGPVRVARRVAAAVLDAEPSPFEAPLRGHPPAALRRRLGWAVTVTAVVTGLLAGAGGLFDAVPDAAWLGGPAVLPVAVVAAVLAYRSLGHAVCGDYLVVRSGLLSRTTVALRGTAVIDWQLRQSVLQRRLGLVTLTATTAAGYGRYAAIDIAAPDAVTLAEQIRPGLLSPFQPPP
ncbi:PH domain-containing protein [Micromonospora sp. CA-263727]|uniref:PH domain-containing protein n=1 Tax=Micromonospora sp. CA-263727 TaxID=3239967 RepID=UPI003D936AA2